MPRRKKDYILLNMKLDAEIGNLLEAFCKVTGQTKTTAVERAVKQYIEEYCNKHLMTDELNHTIQELNK